MLSRFMILWLLCICVGWTGCARVTPHDLQMVAPPSSSLSDFSGTYVCRSSNQKGSGQVYLLWDFLASGIKQAPRGQPDCKVRIEVRDQMITISTVRDGVPAQAASPWRFESGYLFEEKLRYFPPITLGGFSFGAGIDPGGELVIAERSWGWALLFGADSGNWPIVYYFDRSE